MRKYISLLIIILLLPPFVVYTHFALTSGRHHYTKNNIFSFWLYTPESLKEIPFISGNSTYVYDFNIDNQQTRVTIIWSNIDDITDKQKVLKNFIESFNGLNKYDCSWIYNDKNNYMNNYQRYCIFQKEKSLELEYFDTET